MSNSKTAVKAPFRVFDKFSKVHNMSNRFFLTLCLCSSMHSFLLLGFIVYQFFQPLFLNSNIWIFVYLCLFVSLSVDFLYFNFFHKIKNTHFWYSAFLVFDAVLMTVCLSSSLSVLYPLLIVVYSLQITGAGIIGGYQRAFVQGLLASLLSSWMFILYPDSIGQPIVLSFIINNGVFLLSAGLSGFVCQHWDYLNKSILQADHAMSQLTNLNKHIVENMDMGLFILDEDMQVMYSNQKAQKILELPVSFTAPVRQVFPDLHQHIVSGQLQNDNRLETEYSLGENKKSIDMFISPLSVSAETPSIGVPEKRHQQTRFLILFQDCTRWKEMEHKVRSREKFTAIGRMATGIAHEIRNPLSSISDSVQLLDMHLKKKNSENKRLLDLVLTEVSRLNTIVGDFLDYASDEQVIMQDSPLEPVEVNAILEDLLDNVRVNPRWEHITHHFMLKSHGLVQAHSARLKQIFLNVIKNACESMEGREKGQLEIESFDDKEWVVVRVKDTGCGISQEDIPHIFEPFYSRENKRTGLGLSIVQKLVSLYQGEINFTNRQTQKEQGTICTLRFPIQPVSSPGEMAQRKSA